MSDIEIEIEDDMIEDEDLFSEDDFLEDEVIEENDEEEDGENSGEESMDELIDDLDDDFQSHASDLPDENIKCQTIPRLTKYEKTNIIGLRATQIQAGSKPLINLKLLREITPISIAEEELKQRKLDFLKVKRTLPSGKYEIISLKHLKL